MRDVHKVRKENHLQSLSNQTKPNQTRIIKRLGKSWLRIITKSNQKTYFAYSWIWINILVSLLIACLGMGWVF